MQVQFIEVSQNAKTGPMPASIVERASRWPGCALYENGCYAEAGALGMHWDRVSRGLAGAAWSEFCSKVAALRPGRLWAMPKQAISPVTVQRSTAPSSKSWSPPTPANTSSPLPTSPSSPTILSLSRTDA
jgi:hypothetical protein